MHRRLTTQEIDTINEASRRHALGNVQLDTTKLLLIYARQSSQRQYATNVWSAKDQSEGLLTRALELGWTEDERKRLFVENNLIKKLNVSGSLRIDQRPGLKAITELIDPTGIIMQYLNPENVDKPAIEQVKKLARAACKVAAILTVDVARLTRDPDMITPTLLANMCMIAGVVIITDDYVFDFNNPLRDDMGKWMNEAIAAKEYVRKHIKGKMLKARTTKANNGYAGTGIAPVGLLLDSSQLVAKGKPYTFTGSPHAARVDWLYARYRALAANLPDLYREITHMALRGEPLFPLVDGIKPSTIYLKEVYKDGELVGWTIGSRGGLIYILSNPMYAGHMVFNHRIVKMNAFPAIVNADNWQYAFDRLADVDLDGNEIERETKTVHYSNGSTCERPVKDTRSSKNTALMAGTRDNGRAVIDGVNGAHVHVELPNMVYMLRQFHEVTISGYQATILIRELDKIVEDRLLYWVRLSQRQREALYAQGLEDIEPSPYTMMEAVDNTEKQSTGNNSIQADLALTVQKLARVERAINTSADVMDDSDLREAYASKARLIRRKAELEQAVNQAERLKQQQASAKDDIKEAGEKWSKWTLDKRRQFIRLVTSSITLEDIADGWLRLTIAWSPLMGFVYPLESTMRAFEVAYIWRPSGSFWTDNEIQLLRDHWTTASRAEMLRLLPTRSLIAMVRKASEKGIKRLVRDGDCTVPRSMSLSDLEIMSQNGLDGAPGLHWKHEIQVCDDASLSRCFCESTGFAW